MSSSPHGSRLWIGQRLSALALIPLCIWFLFEILNHVSMDYAKTAHWLAEPWIRVGLAIMVSVLLYHSTVGLQVIIEDYIPNLFWQKNFILIIKLANFGVALLAWFFIASIGQE